MIFFDESGKRWRRIKRSTAGLIAIGVLSVAGLVGGALAYQPKWGLLSLPQQIAQAVNPAPAGKTGAPKPNTKSTTAKSNSAKISKSASGATVAYQPAASPLVTTSPSPSPTTSPSPSSSPSPSPSPTTAPGNSTYGNSHKPTR